VVTTTKGAASMIRAWLGVTVGDSLAIEFGAGAVGYTSSSRSSVVTAYGSAGWWRLTRPRYAVPPAAHERARLPGVAAVG